MKPTIPAPTIIVTPPPRHLIGFWRREPLAFIPESEEDEALIDEALEDLNKQTKRIEVGR